MQVVMLRIRVGVTRNPAYNYDYTALVHNA